jgi:hypothetical protein
MFRRQHLARCLLIGAVLLASVGQAIAWPIADEPIAFIGHGVAFDGDGNPIELTPENVEALQGWYIDALRSRLPGALRDDFDERRAPLLAREDWDRPVRMEANAAQLDWLLSRTDIDHDGAIAGKMNLLATVMRTRLFPNQAFTPPAELSAFGVGAGGGTVLFSTMNSGAAYLAECANAGVPTPPDWGGALWVNNGTLSPNFLGGNARVFYYNSGSPEGVCYALPRDNGTDITLLGIICQGKATGNVCFWDNQQDDQAFPIPLGDSVPISEFAGGAELFQGSGGICTACHAGENPYVIHPGSALDLGVLGINTMPDQWYTPLVHPEWPQNAGPLTLFDGDVPAPGQEQCSGCHVQGNAGRFPKISSAINVGVSSYCNAVLTPALVQTMPTVSPGDWSAYSDQVNALEALCNATPTAVMRIEELVLDYGEVELGFSFRKALVVHNDGDAPLTFSVDIPTAAEDPDVDQWSEREGATDRTLAPGDPPAVLRYTYQPDAIASHSFQVEVTGDDGANPAQVVTLTGTGRAPLPIDSMLVLDRSGSMDDAIGERRKIDSMRDAAALYADLLRDDVGDTGTGDKLGFVKYNDANSLYMTFEEMSPARRDLINDAGSGLLSDAALADNSRLLPTGYTGIGGAMQTAAFQFGGAAPADERRQVMIVLTDGKENREPWIDDVLDPIESTFTDLSIYSVGVGEDIEPTKLQAITNVTNGYHQVAPVLSDTTLFDLETFYFKIFAHAAGMDIVVDPTHVVSLLEPDPIIIDRARIVSSDHSATFLVLDDPLLRQFYDLEFLSPSGDVIKPGVTIGGIPIQESRRHTYRVYRIIFPDPSEAASYVGDWTVRLTPNGKWNRDVVRSAVAKSRIHYNSWLSPYEGLVPVGFAAAVASDYRLQVALAPSSYLPGAEVLLTANLTDRGWPAPEGKVDVTVSTPSGGSSVVTLHDDGSHGDQVAGDAIFSNHFVQTASPEVYKFRFHSVGYNERGELAPREATRYLTLMKPEPTPPSRDDPTRDDDRLARLLLLGLLLLLFLIYCCCYRRRG